MMRIVKVLTCACLVFAMAPRSAAAQGIECWQDQYLDPIAFSGTRVRIFGDTLYGTRGTSGLKRVDVSDPENPVVLSDLDTPGSANDVHVVGDLLYVADRDRLRIYNIQNAASPVVIGSYASSGFVRYVHVAGDYAYLGEDTNDTDPNNIEPAGFRVVDVSNPASPVSLTKIYGVGITYEVSVVNQIAYLCSDIGVTLFDVSDPMSPAELSTISEHGGAIGRTITLDGDVLWFSAGPGPSRLYAYDISDPAMPVMLTTNMFGGVGDLTIVGDYAVGDGDGVVVLDLSDPTTPVEIASYNTRPESTTSIAVKDGIVYTSGGSRIRIDPPINPIMGVTDGVVPGDVAISGDLAFYTNNGLHIIDIADPTSPTEIAHAAFASTESNLEVRGDFAYVTHNGGLQIVDVSAPASPVLRGSIPGGTIIYNLDIQGSLLATVGFGGVKMIDVTDPDAPAVVSTVALPGWVNDVQLIGSRAYLVDQFRGLSIYDITSPASPVLISQTPVGPAGGCIRVSGDYAYIGNVNDRGLDVYDIANESAPVLVATLGIDPLDIGVIEIDEIRIQGDKLYFLTAIDGALHAVDISDPNNPAYLAIFNEYAPFGGSNIDLKGEIACIGHDKGLALIDLSACATPCPADVNGDGSLSPADFTAWIAAFNAQAPACDQNTDGLCTPADFTSWIANYNAGC